MIYKPKKQLGQNFLIDKGVIEKIIKLGGITKNDTILEIGPGQGSLTYALFSNARKVIAVEKDEKLSRYLMEKFEGIKNVDFVNEDILEYLRKQKIKKTKNQEYKVVGNIPYYLTSHLIKELLALKNKPTDIILMVQKEVAERMTAIPGEMNILAISIQIFSDPEILFHVSKNSFWPKPKVDSTVIRLRIKQDKLKINEEKFFEIIHAGFSAKRKMLAGNLAKGLGLPKDEIYDIFKGLGLDVKCRAQDLSIENWLKISKELKS
ncbi:MAG TPA: 16S rRNA (adenine(1518)-N(6)/adenine(1519)-N(6))-dimethyltransferase RsmA [Patescibacteria group bacterium]|nr:16S rRNA (adenine(1518)-N(6)/adenine(1519)-N(6))-dimethyltransferase RsmA [Patescibacteria group bacterium]